MHLLTLKAVLVATDLDDKSLPALRSGYELANAAGAALHVAHASASERATNTVYAAAQKAGLALDDAAIHVVSGDPAQAVIELAAQLDVDVIMVGPHRADPAAPNGSTFGSSALSLVTNARVPCLVVERPLRLPLERVVVAVDLSDTARGALVIALSWASALRAPDSGGGPATTLTVLNVSTTSESADDEPARTRALENELKRVRYDAGGWAGITIDSAVTSHADAAAGIAGYANDWRADLVVLGTRGLGLDGVGRLGSVSFAAMQQAKMPTLLVPPAVWMTYASQS